MQQFCCSCFLCKFCFGALIVLPIEHLQNNAPVMLHLISTPYQKYFILLVDSGGKLCTVSKYFREMVRLM